jgi:Bifunctional DNA primase/polymerase, N-terminal
MTSLEQALKYTNRVPVFPCRCDGGPRLRKTPLTRNGFKDASCDPTMIREWWTRWPHALIGMPTGEITGLVVLDVDVKRPDANGFDSLEDLGRSIPIETPMAHTESGGLHIYFRCPQQDVRNSAGRIGAGLDVRANGGYVILPSPGSGYAWDTVWNFETVEPAAAPDWLWPAPAGRTCFGMDLVIPTIGLSRYAEVSLDAACNAITRAPDGQQEQTLNCECFRIGTLAGAGGIPESLALKALLYAANRMPDYDLRWSWRSEEIDYKVRRAFGDGVVHPRRLRTRYAG